MMDADDLRAYDQRTASEQKAARLYPHSLQLQVEWLRAVAVVRVTQRGWLLDKPLKRDCNGK